MKTKKILFILAFCAMFVGCHQDKLDSFADNGKITDSKEPEKKLPWDYPVKPGTEEWKKFQTSDEMIAVCQIPEDILSHLSTEDLTEICLLYPFMYDIFAFNNINDGLDKIFGDFNGIRELYKRNDVSAYLLKLYNEKIQNFSYLDGKASYADQGHFIMSISILEALLSKVKEQNNNGTRFKEILKELVVGYEGKLKRPDDFAGIGFRSNFFSRVKVILTMDPTFVLQLPEKERNSALSGLPDEQSINVIDEWSFRLIK